MTEELWSRLFSKDNLRRGWHLTRTDMQTDFIDNPFAKEEFGHFLEENLDELVRTLRSGNFRPNPIKRISIPKGHLGTRPGTLISIEDRVVLFSALNIIADEVDSTLSESVYSYRVKNNRKSGKLFRESDIVSLPFLKSKTVRKYIYPFDPWYGLWPKFDEISKEAFQKDNYIYMATSDIAAYFENIQIDMLRDQMNSIIPDKQKIVNLFMSAFSTWTYDTNQGKRYMRGIPQGTSISSFFGNIFLKPIDDAFEKIKKDEDILYYRYMDDIRIFTKDYELARSAILLLDKSVRHLHLNLQTAKTRIYDENDGEITAALIDRRMAQVEDIRGRMRDQKSIDTPEITNLIKKVMDENPDNKNFEQKIGRARKPLRGLSDRVFRSLISLDQANNSTALLDRLIREIEKNSDYRLGLKVIQYSKRFPRKNISKKLFSLIERGKTIFPFQEAQILEAIRYQSRIDKNVYAYCCKQAGNSCSDRLVRMQSFRLLSRSELDGKTIKMSRDVFERDDDIFVIKSASLILIRQHDKHNSAFIRCMVFHPNDSIRKFGKLVRAIKRDSHMAKTIVSQAFKVDWVLVDYLPFLFLIAESNDIKIANLLLDNIQCNKRHRTHVNMDMRERLGDISRRIKGRIESVREF